MSKYKLSPEEIRERANKISNASRPDITKDILALIEETTGEKIPEPFDFSKVRFGEVWRSRYYTLIILDTCGNYIFQSILGTRDWQPGPTSTSPDFLRNLEYKHVGTFDFTAGLPKEAA